MLGHAVIHESEKDKSIARKIVAPAVQAFRFFSDRERITEKASYRVSEAKMENAFKIWTVLDDKLPK